MDKFDRRPTAKDRRRQLVLFVVAFGGVAACFGALFAFGNTAALWVLGVYGIVLIWLAWTRITEELSFHRSQWNSLPLLPAQGPGFSALETAAFSALFDAAELNAAAIKQGFQGAEVRLRWNTGTGCLTAIQGVTGPVSEQALSAVPWFDVEGIGAPVGCRFWSQDGILDLMEFFTGGEPTRDLDWTRVRFGPTSHGNSGLIPESRPTIDIERMKTTVENALVPERNEVSLKR